MSLFIHGFARSAIRAILLAYIRIGLGMVILSSQVIAFFGRSADFTHWSTLIVVMMASDHSARTAARASAAGGLCARGPCLLTRAVTIYDLTQIAKHLLGERQRMAGVA